MPSPITTELTVDAGAVALAGDLVVPVAPAGVILFAHGSGSSRHSPRNRSVATALQAAGFATLLMDLLDAEEERRDSRTRELRFDIPLLGERLRAAVDWLGGHRSTANLPVGCFGASTGAAAAIEAAAARPDRVAAVVSRGGRPDLASPGALERLRAPTLLLVGARDEAVIGMNRDAMRDIRAPVELEIVPGAGHLFEEPGALDRVMAEARRWFLAHLGARGA